LDDNTEIAQKLFVILNFIAEELITKPKELEDLLADLIPSDTQEHIKQRDGTKQYAHTDHFSVASFCVYPLR
jgi:hypothetical protein